MVTLCIFDECLGQVKPNAAVSAILADIYNTAHMTNVKGLRCRNLRLFIRSVDNRERLVVSRQFEQCSRCFQCFAIQVNDKVAVRIPDI